MIQVARRGAVQGASADHRETCEGTALRKRVPSKSNTMSSEPQRAWRAQRQLWKTSCTFYLVLNCLTHTVLEEKNVHCF